MLNFVFKSFKNYFTANKALYYFDMTPETCGDQISISDTPLNGILANLLTANFTEIMIAGTEPQPPVETRTVAEARVVLPFGAEPLEFSSSALLPVVSEIVSEISQSEFYDLLKALGVSWTFFVWSKYPKFVISICPLFDILRPFDPLSRTSVPALPTVNVSCL
jgi:hypothetical protein